jgi:hypothetical protein
VTIEPRAHPPVALLDLLRGLRDQADPTQCAAIDAYLALGEALVNPAEVTAFYVAPGERFVVSLICGYAAGDLTPTPDLARPEDLAASAAHAALELTRDEGADGTHWFVHDRETRETYLFEQSEFDDRLDPSYQD